MERHNLKSYEPNEIFINGKAIPDDRIVACVNALAGIDDPEALMRLSHLNVEALAEIKATVDGKSDQPVKDIIYGLIDEIEHLKGGAE